MLRETVQWAVGALGLLVAVYAVQQTSSIKTADYAERIRENEIDNESNAKLLSSYNQKLRENSDSLVKTQRELGSIKIDVATLESNTQKENLEKRFNELSNRIEVLSNRSGYDIKEVSKYLVTNHAGELRGKRGPVGQSGPEGPKGESGDRGLEGPPGAMGPAEISQEVTSPKTTGIMAEEVAQSILNSKEFLKILDAYFTAKQSVGVVDHRKSKYPKSRKEGIYVEVRMLKKYTQTRSSGRVTTTFFLRNEKQTAINIAIDENGIRYVDNTGLICDNISLGYGTKFGGLSYANDRAKRKNNVQYKKVSPNEEIIFTVSKFQCDDEVIGTEGTMSVTFLTREGRELERLSLQIFDVKFGENFYVQ